MWRHKNKSQPEQGTPQGRQVQRGGGAGPAFSYYSSTRNVDPARERPEGRGDAPAGANRWQADQDQSSGKRRRLNASQLPLLFLMALGLVCLAKVLWLGTSPKVMVVDKSPVAATYLQPTSVYAAAAHRLLASSVTNHTKLTADLNGTAKRLQQQFPELAAVSLGVPLISSRPIVYVQVAQPSLLIQTAHGNYALNAAGVALARLQTAPDSIPVVVDQSNTVPKPGKQFLPSSTVSFVRTVSYQLTAATLNASAFVLPAGSPYELDVRLSGKPYYIKFNLAAEALAQSGAAIATLQQLGSASPGNYLDVRVPGRVYYK
jgi:hypothetical protein